MHIYIFHIPTFNFPYLLALYLSHRHTTSITEKLYVAISRDLIVPQKPQSRLRRENKRISFTNIYIIEHILYFI